MKTTVTLMMLIALCMLFMGCASVPGTPIKWACYLEDSNAKQQDTWNINDGVLTCTGTPLGYLYTDESYSDFTMTFQWRWPDGRSPGKGGILIRATGPDKIWPKSLEAQINADNAGDFWALDGYELIGPNERMKSITHEKFGKLTHVVKTEAAENTPGQWNSYKIIAEGPIVTLIINERIVNQTIRAATYSGKICITSEGTPIQFRDIKITPAPKVL